MIVPFTSVENFPSSQKGDMQLAAGSFLVSSSRSFSTGRIAFAIAHSR